MMQRFHAVFVSPNIIFELPPIWAGPVLRDSKHAVGWQHFFTAWCIMRNLWNRELNVLTSFPAGGGWERSTLKFTNLSWPHCDSIYSIMSCHPVTHIGLDRLIYQPNQMCCVYLAWEFPTKKQKLIKLATSWTIYTRVVALWEMGSSCSKRETLVASKKQDQGKTNSKKEALCQW